MNCVFTMLYYNVLFFLLFITFLSAANRTNAPPSRVLLKLIHPSKVHDDITFKDLVQRAKRSSLARYNYLKNTQTSQKDVIQGGLTTDLFGFYVNFSIGSPPVSQMAIMDSGSELLWIQCLPCVHCFRQDNLFYNPSKSSTYSEVIVFTPDCKVPQFGATMQDPCRYELNYVDRTSSKGEIAKEKLIFPTQDEGLIALPGLIFGCGHDNYGRGLKNGILGLDASPASLVSQLGNKFSYCLGNLSDVSYEYNQLVLGEGAVLEGESTPIQIVRDKYHVTLEGITFGDTKLNVDPNIFKLTPERTGGVMIDSGSFHTYLARSAYNALINQIDIWNDGRLYRRILSSGDVCYSGVMSRDLGGFPVVRFQFSGGALMEIDYEGIFYQDGNGLFCVAFTSVDDGEVNVIGVKLQQYFNFGFDIPNKMLYFQRIDCELFES